MSSTVSRVEHTRTDESSQQRSGKLNNKENSVESPKNQSDDLIYQGNQTLDMVRLKYTLLGKEGWWWLFEDALEEIAQRLCTDNFAVLDDFLATNDADALVKELKRAYIAGNIPDTKHSMVGCPRMEPGALAGGPAGNNLSYKLSAVRGDHVAWFSGEEKACSWVQLPKYLQKIDTLVAELSEYVEELKGITIRSRAMATCYPGGGAHYVKHCDNVSTKTNGRKLTILFYANKNWKSGDGGELKVFEPACVESSPVDTVDAITKPKTSNTPHKCTIQPLLNRVVMFWSDERVPHEVNPAAKLRFAITTWFFDEGERKIAQLKSSEISRDQKAFQDEKERIAKEILSFENKYGAKAKVLESADEGNLKEKKAGAQVEEGNQSFQTRQEDQLEFETKPAFNFTGIQQALETTEDSDLDSDDYLE